jgi:predicted NBD/HSP70 family sugar kinase
LTNERKSSYGCPMPARPVDGLPVLSASTREIITTLLRSGPLARADLARRLSLSPASLTKLTRPMLDIGLFQQLSPTGEQTAGRPSIPLSVDADWAHFIGIKLTGDTAFGALTDLKGSVIDHLQRPLRGTSVPSVMDDIVALVNSLAAGATPVGVGVGLAGRIVRRRGVVIDSPFLGWSNVALSSLMEATLGLPVAVENDLRALTTALRWFDEDSSSFALVTFGAGIGCGLVLNDRVLEGAGGAAGLVAHLRVDDNGPRCARGHRGCASAYATTAAILTEFARASGRSAAGLQEVAARARDGDELAARVLTNAGYAIGALIGTICNITGPACVILSGEGVEVVDTMADAIGSGMSDVAHPTLPPVALRVTPLQFTDWARAAAVVAIEEYLLQRSTSAA